MKHIVGVVLIFWLLLITAFAGQAPQFTFQESQNISPHALVSGLGYVDFGNHVGVEYMGQSIEKYFDDDIRCPVSENDCKNQIPEKSDGYLFFENMLGKQMLEGMIQNGQASVYGSDTREGYISNNAQLRNTPEYQTYSEKCFSEYSPECERLYKNMIDSLSPVSNARIQKTYRITSDTHQKIPVKIFPISPIEYIFSDEEVNYEVFSFPTFTFLDPIYEYYHIGISGGNYVMYKGERIYSNRDIPEYREIAQEIQRITTSPLTIVAREKQFQEQYEKIFALLNSSDREEHSPNGLIRPTKKYMITRFTPENYIFPGFSDKFMYNTSYVIVPYYEAEIEVQEGENTFSIEYQKFVPDVGIFTD